MNIGIRLHDTKPGSLKERLAYAKAQGFTCMQLALSKSIEGFSMEDAPEKLTEEMAAWVREELAEAGMECAVLGCYLNLTDPDAERRERTRRIYRAHLRFARMIGARVVGTETPAPAGVDFGTAPWVSEPAYQLMRECLLPIVRDAEEAGAILAVEPVWCHILSTPERAERLLTEVASDHLQVILDGVNLVSPEEAGRYLDVIQNGMNRLGDRVRVLHMKDFTLKNGQVVSSACGTGDMDLRPLLTFAKLHDLPMTLEDTVPENAEAARLYLESIAAEI